MEQFLFALYPDGLYHFHKSPGVDRLLSDANIQWLRQKKVNRAEPYWLPTEQVVALQHIEPVTHYGRSGIWNYTLLIPIDEYIRRTDPYDRFATYFITPSDDPPISLPSING